MCGRYFRRSDKQGIADAFKLGKLPDGFVLPPWDYNVAPTTFQPVIRNSKETGERELVLMRWGMVPHFAKSLNDFKGFSTINAKAETLMKTAMWRVPFQRRRCLVPADGFYEWKVVHAGEAPDAPKGKAVKQPYAFSMKDDRPFAFGGIWDAWKDPVNGDWLQSFAIVTTEPNELTATVHNRMPLILEPRDYDRRLERDPGSTIGNGHGQMPLDLLRPLPADEMKAQKANKDVGNVKNNHAELLNSA
jgi:putative SOS response-associated peptidase YedK